MEGVEPSLLQLDVVQGAGAGGVPYPQDPHLRVWHNQHQMDFNSTENHEGYSEHSVNPFLTKSKAVMQILK